MPASFAARRLESDMAVMVGPLPVAPYEEARRYAIVALGVVISIQVLPATAVPFLRAGQKAIASADLLIGDRA